MASRTILVLPVPGEPNKLILSALPYSNATPHLGNLIGSTLSADTAARFFRARGARALYDQYGTASETKAFEEGVDPTTLCAKYHKMHKEIYDWFRIDFDIFGQTPTPQYTQIVRDIFRKLWVNDFIEERMTVQPYCQVHSGFLADRFVEAWFEDASKGWTEQWWKNSEEVELYHFLGKDNVSFHSIVFPGSQIGSGDNWTKARHISATEYLNYEGGKFSKLKGVGLFGNNAKDTGIDADIWRYYLLSRRPESGIDTEFKWEEFIDVNNNDLLKNIGNLVNRVVKFCHAKMEGVVPSYIVSEEHRANVNALLTTYIAHLEAMKLRLGLSTILQISSFGNKFLQDNKLDNHLIEGSPERCRNVVGTVLSHIHLLANLLSPFMLRTAESIFEQLGVESKPKIPDTWATDTLVAGSALGESRPLFTVIPAAKLEEWKEAYGGAAAKEQKRLEAEKAATKKAAKKAKKERSQLSKKASTPVEAS
ncbi:hypothetical protein VE02_08042 [Pseudogymnoascus sp. 03VT05]|nr:hypothetical protein VE02_08042 [Pseudogymnoascus sp. 03VT05]